LRDARPKAWLEIGLVIRINRAITNVFGNQSGWVIPTPMMVKKAPKTKEKKKQEAKVINNLENIATKVHSDFKKVRIPNYGIPTRTKSNIVFHEKKRVWKYGDSETVRSAKTLDGAYTLLRTMFTIDFVKEMIKVNKSSTLREMYYISEGWGMAKFHAQNESDKLIEDLEIVTRDMREDFKLRPEEDGARVIGDLTIEETVRSGKKRIINTKEDVGDAGYTIPYNVEMDRLRFKKNKCKFLVAIETGGMFDRLVENGFDEEHKAMLVHLKGQPARSTRRFIKRLNEEMNLPVICFTDGDPWSFRIFASVAYGALLLLVYALGHSVLIIAAGTSVGIARKLIESRKITRATEIMRRGAGGVIVLVGLFFVYTALK